MGDPRRILITGSEGLVGTSVRMDLEAAGYDVIGLDRRATGSNQGNVCDAEKVRVAVTGCVGIVHLAAVSRVIWAERDPQQCWDTNVGGLNNIVVAATRQISPPWLLFASSREVYGQPDRLPATEDTPLCPVNIYGHSKQEGERIVNAAQNLGLCTAIVRLSNVYGRIDDHGDRVVPAFARAAVQGEPLRVDGADHTFDFTHIDDTSRGILQLIALLESGQTVPSIHLLTSKPTTLGDLASLAIKLADSGSSIRQSAPRSYDVSNFFGNPARAAEILDWTPQTELAKGLMQLIADFRSEYQQISIEETTQ